MCIRDSPRSEVGSVILARSPPFAHSLALSSSDRPATGRRSSLSDSAMGRCVSAMACCVLSWLGMLEPKLATCERAGVQLLFVFPA
eukprot:4994849-Pyramimonas_sp.AAC.1